METAALIFGLSLVYLGDILMIILDAKVGFKDKEHRYRDMRYKF